MKHTLKNSVQHCFYSFMCMCIYMTILDIIKDHKTIFLTHGVAGENVWEHLPTQWVT